MERKRYTVPDANIIRLTGGNLLYGVSGEDENDSDKSNRRDDDIKSGSLWDDM